MSVKLGKAKYGNNFVQRKWFKLKDGQSTFRILPPLGDLADSGRWSMFYSIHYGYRNSEKKMKVFLSSLVKNRQTRMVEVPDAALERIEKLKAGLEGIKNSGDKAAIEELKALLQNYNLDNNHYLNVIDESGSIGVLKLRHRAKMALDSAIKKLNERGVDPLSAENGRWFVFERSGTGPQTSFTVEVKTESLNVDKVGLVNRDIVHVLTDDVIGRLGTEAAELDKLFKRLTAEEIETVVKTSDLKTGISSALDTLFATKAVATPIVEEGFDEEDVDMPTETAATGATAASSTTASVASPTVTPETVTVTPETVTVTPKASAQQEEEKHKEFLKSLGLDL